MLKINEAIQRRAVNRIWVGLCGHSQSKFIFIHTCISLSVCVWVCVNLETLIICNFQATAVPIPSRSRSRCCSRRPLNHAQSCIVAPREVEVAFPQMNGDTLGKWHAFILPWQLPYSETDRESEREWERETESTKGCDSNRFPFLFRTWIQFFFIELKIFSKCLRMGTFFMRIFAHKSPSTTSATRTTGSDTWQIFIEHDFWNMNIFSGAVDMAGRTWIANGRGCPAALQVTQAIRRDLCPMRGMSYIWTWKGQHRNRKRTRTRTRNRTRTQTRTSRQSRGSKHQLLIARVRDVSPASNTSNTSDTSSPGHWPNKGPGPIPFA